MWNESLHSHPLLYSSSFIFFFIFLPLFFLSLLSFSFSSSLLFFSSSWGAKMVDEREYQDEGKM